MQLLYEVDDAAKGETSWLHRHLAGLSKQLKEQAVVANLWEKALELAQAAQYRHSLRLRMHSSPADMDDEEVITALRVFQPHRQSVFSLPPISLPTATIPPRMLLKRVLRREDDRSAAGPDGMPFPRLKFLVRPRTGETAENSSFAALHGFVCLLSEGRVSSEAEKIHAWASLLACTKPNGKYRPIAIGIVSRRLVSCYMMKLALPGTRKDFAPLQISKGVPAGTEFAIHAFCKCVARFGWDPGREALFIDARNALNEGERQMIFGAVSAHATGLVKYVHMVYVCAPCLIAGKQLIRSLQGTQQGDPLGMYLFSLVIQPFIGELQSTCQLDLNIWCADDGLRVQSFGFSLWGTLVGEFTQLSRATPILQKAGLFVGYHLEVTKSKLRWPTFDQSSSLGGQSLQ